MEGLSFYDNKAVYVPNGNKALYATSFRRLCYTGTHIMLNHHLTQIHVLPGMYYN